VGYWVWSVRALGVLKVVQRGPMGPPRPLELSALFLTPVGLVPARRVLLHLLTFDNVQVEDAVERVALLQSRFLRLCDRAVKAR
jgi:hypothetical protein